MNRAQRVLNILKTPLRSYNEVAQRYPFETGVVTTVVKTSAADLFAQKVSTQFQALMHHGALYPAAVSCCDADYRLSRQWMLVHDCVVTCR